MKASRIIRSLALIAAAIFATSTYAASAKEKAALEEVLSHDGLSKINIKGVDLVYARPGASLAAYDKIKIDPVEVSFAKNWDPNRPGSNFKITNEEREKIRNGVAQIVNEEFVRELQKKDAYKVVTEAGPDVLRIKVNILNLYVTAPDIQAPGMVRTYTTSAGEMTLCMELFDSETGQVLARVVDRREARSVGSGNAMRFANSVNNRAEAANIAQGWAHILRNGLDKAHGIGKK